ncbi:phosphatase PAP2 family protein [Chitinophaga tropicalis]|uniref:PAP2 superfamily protein n=1 Tax=Chitinophaga tropicalis TaxID=2683588 RepID=A0A7K1TYP4_9BACT|nr:phosphatase PAP2 family protein [Chitinophaga tropicalis]MVT07231.1 hypothetical protein [Chitinophaga tropicalis]
MEQVTIPATNNTRQEQPEFSPVLRFVSEVIAYLSHPLFIPLIVTIVMVNALPEYFVVFKHDSVRLVYDKLVLRVISITIFFPLLTVMIARALNFVESLKMESKKDRIIPYVANTIYFFWAYYAFKREGIAPPFFNAFFLGVFIAVIMSMVANTYFKISMHTVGWGGVLGFLLMLMTGMHMNISQPLIAAFLVSGIVATSRLILSAHTPGEIYAGFIVGILSQLIAYGIVG